MILPFNPLRPECDIYHTQNWEIPDHQQGILGGVVGIHVFLRFNSPSLSIIWLIFTGLKCYKARHKSQKSHKFDENLKKSRKSHKIPKFRKNHSKSRNFKKIDKNQKLKNYVFNNFLWDYFWDFILSRVRHQKTTSMIISMKTLEILNQYTKIWFWINHTIRLMSSEGRA